MIQTPIFLVFPSNECHAECNEASPHTREIFRSAQNDGHVGQFVLGNGMRAGADEALEAALKYLVTIRSK